MTRLAPAGALAAALALTFALSACDKAEEADADAALAQVTVARTCVPIADDVIKVDGGSFAMGSDFLPEEGRIRQTRVDDFWIDVHEVTNRQFAEFVAATGYVTMAEKPVDPALFGVPVDQIPAEMLLPGSAVFSPPAAPSNNFNDWWSYVPGANWRLPEGPDGPKAVDDHPVVHMGREDMLAYAKWRGGRLPTEAEWEYAAGKGEERYTEQPDANSANSWQGVFPVQNQATDGFKGLAPVGCYEPNAIGLYDMVGNVWEVTSDFYVPGHNPEDTDNPRGPSEAAAASPATAGFASLVMKGGSYLCAPNYCQRYRPQSRQARDPGLGASNAGFRLAYDAPPEKM
jgi:formylglycine-generating enzyme required for sulfatase activity